jgi:hypothetical protein
VLVEGDGEGNSQIVHFGGDSGTTSQYRDGTLHFFHNTVVSTRSGNTTLFRLSFPGSSLDARNNVFFATAGGNRLAIVAADGDASLTHNWLPTGWRDSHSGATGTITASDNVEGAAPGFADVGAQDFTLSAGAAADGAAGPLAGPASAHPVRRAYVVHRGGAARATANDQGAFERD